MSIKDFFTIAVLKNSAIEFLKNRAEFDTLSFKYKKPFRGQVLPTDVHSKYTPTAPGFRISDGSNTIQCTYSDECLRRFEDTYPSCVKITDLNNLVVCVQQFKM